MKTCMACDGLLGNQIGEIGGDVVNGEDSIVLTVESCERCTPLVDHLIHLIDGDATTLARIMRFTHNVAAQLVDDEDDYPDFGNIPTTGSIN